MFLKKYLKIFLKVKSSSRILYAKIKKFVNNNGKIEETIRDKYLSQTTNTKQTLPFY